MRLATLHRFELAAAHEFFGLMFPTGTVIRRGSSNRPWEFRLPPTTGVNVPAFATTAPPGVTLTVSKDGRLERIGSGHGQTITVRGLPLSSKRFRLEGDTVVSEPADSFLLGGVMQLLQNVGRYRHPEHPEKYAKALRKAGLPE